MGPINTSVITTSASTAVAKIPATTPAKIRAATLGIDFHLIWGYYYFEVGTFKIVILVTLHITEKNDN